MSHEQSHIDDLDVQDFYNEEVEISSYGINEEEIEEYARFLGMDPESSVDRELLWIAKKGLMEPVPRDWQALKDSNDNIIYYNTVTKVRTHQHPCDEEYKLLYRMERQKYDNMLADMARALPRPSLKQKKTGSAFQRGREQEEQSRLSDQAQIMVGRDDSLLHITEEVGESEDQAMPRIDWKAERIMESATFNRNKNDQAKGILNQQDSDSAQLISNKLKQSDMENADSSQNASYAQLNLLPAQRLPKSKEPAIQSQQDTRQDLPLKNQVYELVNSGLQGYGQPFVISSMAQRVDMPNAIHHGSEVSLGQANFSQHPATINSFASPAFMLQNSRIGEVSMSTSFLQEATHILSLYNQECQQKLVLLHKEKEFELRIIAQSLKKAQQDQLHDLNHSMKFEVQTIKQTLIADAEGEIAEQKGQLVRDKEILLLQRDEFARKDAELEAERIFRHYQEKMAEEKERQQTINQLQVQQIKFTTDSKIKLETSRIEMKNDQLFELSTQLTSLQEQLVSYQSETEHNIERKRQNLEQELRQNRQLFARQLQEQRNTALLRVRSKYQSLITDKQFQLSKQTQEQQIQSDIARAELNQKIKDHLATKKDEQDVFAQEKTRNAQVYSDKILESLKKEIRHKVELEHQRQFNQISADGYRKVRAAQNENQDKYALIKQQELRSLKQKIDAEFAAKMNTIQEERELLDSNCSVQERVLEEMKLTKLRISEMRRTKEELEETLLETAMDRTKLEHKAYQIKQDHVKDGVKVEVDLKIEFEQKKLELEQLQDQVNSTRRTLTQEKRPLRQTEEVPAKVNAELKAIKSLVQGLIGCSREESKTVDLAQLIPKEQAKVKDKIHRLRQEKAKVENFAADLEVSLFEGVDMNAAASRLADFKREIDNEQQQIKLETLRIGSQITGLEKSLKILDKMQRKLKESPDQDLQNDFKLYIRSRQDQQRGHISAQRQEASQIDQDWMKKNLRDLVVV